MNLETEFSDINTWPFQEARKLIERTKDNPDKQIVFETKSLPKPSWSPT